MERFGTIWRETPSLTRRLCAILPVLGSLIIALGVVGDSHGWWDNRAFLTNLVSSFTGLMFAIPFALVVLGRLGNEHARLAQQSAVRSLATRSFESLREAAASLEEMQIDLEQCAPASQVDRFALLDHTTGDRALAAVETRWTDLRDNLRFRLAEVELPRLSHDSWKRIDAAVRGVSANYSLLRSHIAADLQAEALSPFSDCFRAWARDVVCLKSAIDSVTFEFEGDSVFGGIWIGGMRWEWPRSYR